MKHWMLSLIVPALFSFDQLAAQSSRDVEPNPNSSAPAMSAKAKESSAFKDRLWYGLGLGIGFSGYNGASQFGFGLSPMVGYKIIGPISAGPRVSVFYTALKVAGYKNLNLFDTEAGVFLRGRVFRGFFLQGELSNSWTQSPTGYSTGNKLEKVTNQRFNQYVGAGYNWGGGDWSSEIGLFYNIALANDLYADRQPLDYRLNFTYRF